jgi:hypothetical protein
MSDEFVDFQLAIQVVVYQIRQLSSALDAAKSAALPHSAGNQLKCCMSVSAIRFKKVDCMAHVSLRFPVLPQLLR